MSTSQATFRRPQERSEVDTTTCTNVIGAEIMAIANQVLASNLAVRVLLLLPLPRGDCCSPNSDLRWPNAWSACRDMVNADLRRQTPELNLTLVAQRRAAASAAAVANQSMVQYNKPPDVRVLNDNRGRNH